MKLIATELIAYQNNDQFPIKLTESISELYEEMDKGLYGDNTVLLQKSSVPSDIVRLIRDRFNLNIEFDPIFHRYAIAAVIPFFGDYLSDVSGTTKFDASLVSSLFNVTDINKRFKIVEKERKEMVDKLHNKKGYIDLKNARVSGYMANLKHYLIIDFFALRTLGLTPGEVAAIITHEIGHAFTGLEYHHKLETTNSTILDILNELNKNNTEKAVYIFKRRFGKKEFEDLSVNTTNEIYDFYGKVALAYISEIKSQLPNSKYDETNFENLADSFVTRLGLSKELVSALDKLHKEHANTYQKSSALYGVLFFIDLMLNIIFLAIFSVVGVFIAAAMIVILYSSNNITLTYDAPLDRYNRVRNSVINNLKNINLPSNTTKELLKQLEFIETVMQNSMEYKSIKQSIADFMLSGNRNNAYYIKLQQTIENNLNNLLFIKASQLKVSSTPA